MNALQRYDKIAGLNGWLPIGISRPPAVSPQTVRDAAERCEKVFPELAAELRAHPAASYTADCRALIGRDGKPTNVCACGAPHQPPKISYGQTT